MELITNIFINTKCKFDFKGLTIKDQSLIIVKYQILFSYEL